MASRVRRGTIFAIAAVLGLLGLGAAPAFATAPPNDGFSDAIVLEGDSSEAVGNVEDATEEPGEPDRLGDMAGRSVWFSWTPARSGYVRVSCTSSFDPVIAVYTGST